MYDRMRIDDDGTPWSLSQPIIPAQLIGASKPLAIPVIWPLRGTLLLAVRAAARVTLLPPTQGDDDMWPWGWIPGGQGKPLSPFIYVPTSFGQYLSITSDATTLGPGPDPLPEGIDLPMLEGQLIAAMTTGTRVEVQTGSSGQDALVLNGAVLPFVALFPPQQSPAGLVPRLAIP